MGGSGGSGAGDHQWRRPVTGRRARSGRVPGAGVDVGPTGSDQHSWSDAGGRAEPAVGPAVVGPRHRSGQSAGRRGSGTSCSTTRRVPQPRTRPAGRRPGTARLGGAMISALVSTPPGPTDRPPLRRPMVSGLAGGPLRGRPGRSPARPSGPSPAKQTSSAAPPPTCSHLRWGWVVIALGAEAVSYLSYASLQRRLLWPGNVRIPMAPDDRDQPGRQRHPELAARRDRLLRRLPVPPVPPLRRRRRPGGLDAGRRQRPVVHHPGRPGRRRARAWPSARAAPSTWSR